MARKFGMIGALLGSAAMMGIAATPAERKHGRLMRAPDHNSSWPAWFYGPNGQSDVFDSVAEVPEGWQDHPSKVVTPEKTGSKPMPPKTDAIPPEQRGAAPVVAKNSATAGQTGGAPAEPGDQSNTLDAHGWPWTAELHSATQSQTGQGLWRMKVGVSRPAPKEGYPKPDAPLDL